nr:Spo0B domain-containing protein [Cohnella sp. CFH 77786]
MLDHARLSAIRTLSHHRHDWMNDLQILYGYLRLNKPDKAAEIVDRIRGRMENDSRVSQLGNAELSTYLLSFRTICDHMRLDVNVGEGVSLDRLPLDSDKLASCLIGLVNAIRYRTAAPASGESLLRMSIFRTEEALHVELEYEGEWASGQSLGLAGEAQSLLEGLGQFTEEEEAGAQGKSRRLLATFPLTA